MRPHDDDLWAMWDAGFRAGIEYLTTLRECDEPIMVVPSTPIDVGPYEGVTITNCTLPAAPTEETDRG